MPDKKPRPAQLRLQFETDPWALAGQVKRILPDEFCHQMIDGALRVIEDRTNPVRLHSFSAAIRELLTHLLHELAPDDEIKKCSWFKPEDRTSRPTRRQRAIYLAQGGLSDETVGLLGIGIAAKAHADVLKVMNGLNKYTHVRPGTVINDQHQIEEFASEAFKSFDSLFYAIKMTRALIANALTRQYAKPLDQCVRQALAEAEELQGRTDLEPPYLEGIEVLGIDISHVRCRVEGSLNDTVRFRLDLRAPVDNIAAFELLDRSFREGEFPPDE